MVKCIAYKGGYKYQLKRTYTVRIPIVPSATIGNKYVSLDTDGILTIQEGYAWDGPSGPMVDIPSSMRGSLVHDALYQLMREGYLDRKVYRQTADRTLRDMCMEDGMWSILAWCVYYGVRGFADPAADPASKRPITYAPRVCKPMFKRAILAVVAVFLAFSVLDFVIHGLLLQATYKASADLWRPMDEMKMPLMYLVTMVFTVSFVAIYGLMVAKKSLLSGIQFGALFGLACGVSMGFGSYCYMPIPLSLAWSWFFGSLVETIAAGAIVGAILKPGEDMAVDTDESV